MQILSIVDDFNRNVALGEFYICLQLLATGILIYKRRNEVSTHCVRPIINH